MDRKEKTIRYKIRTGAQWLLVSLLTTSTILPSITATVSASTKETKVSQNIDAIQEELENSSEDNKNREFLAAVEENDERDTTNSITSESVNTQNNNINDVEKTTRESDDIASGKFGTSEWRIDSQGTLHIGEGEFSDTTSLLSPWNDWAEEIINIHFEGKVVAGNIIAGLFRGMPNLVSIENMQNLDTSNTTDMRVVFKESTALKQLDLTSWNTSKVTTIYGIFDGASSLEDINVSNWDTSNFIQLGYSFRNLPNLKELDLSEWSPSPITSSTGITLGGYISMFEGDRSLESLDLSGFSTLGMNMYYLGKTSFDNMFSGMTSLKILTLGNDFKFNIQYPYTAGLPDINPTNRYTGKWVNVGNGTLDSPESSRVWSSANLMYNLKVNSSYVGTTETYVWQRIKGSDVTVKYEDELGNPIPDIKDIILSGYIDDEYVSELKDIEGYTFKEVKDNNATGVFTDQAQTVTYVYTKNLVAGADVTIKYVDEDNQSIPGISDKIISGNVGDSYDVSTEDYQIPIPGYRLDSANLPENMIGQIAENPQEVIYRYIKNKTALNVHDSTLYVGDKWSAEDNFDQATDYYGNNVPFSEISVTGEVDTSKTGTYKVTYYRFIPNFLDSSENQGTYSAIATITVKDKQTAVNVHDSTLYVGDKWSAEDNFDSAFDKDGKSVDFKDITVTGEVDTSKAGTYEITYSYDGMESIATVTVLEGEAEQDLAHITVHDSELKVGEKWSPEDNFDEATSFDGKDENFSDIIVEGNVDTTKPGTYEVTYSIPEEHWGRDLVEGHHTATAKIVVTEENSDDDRDSILKEKGSTTDKANSSSAKDISRENNTQNTKELPKTGEHTSALIFMLGIALLILGSIFSVLHVKKNK